jgi:hypothetical protein
MKDIIVHFDPTRTLKSLRINDLEFGTNGNPIHGEKGSKKAGASAVYVQINDYVIPTNDIISCEINTDGFLPELYLTIGDSTGLLLNNSYPVDGDQINLLIRSINSDFKNIRCDFRIMNVASYPAVNGDSIFSMIAILDIPELYNDRIVSFGKDTSLNTLKKIAKELQLGFASNVTATNDEMVRLCANTSYIDFILNDVIQSAYLDDDSFFTCYIDINYNLCLVEVNELLINNNSLEKITNTTWSMDWGYDDPEKTPFLSDFIMSNHKDLGATLNYITAYSLENNSGDSFMKHGYLSTLIYYDKKNEKIKDFFVESLNDPSTTSDRIILKGRKDEDHRSLIKNYYFNDMFVDNVHKNYYYAKINNNINLENINKVNLKITTAAVNPAISKFKIIPIQIVNVSKTYIDWENNTSAGSDQYSINKLLSDFYVATGISYIYDSSKKYLYQMVNCSKREFSRLVNS